MVSVVKADGSRAKVRPTTTVGNSNASFWLISTGEKPPVIQYITLSFTIYIILGLPGLGFTFPELVQQGILVGSSIILCGSSAAFHLNTNKLAKFSLYLLPLYALLIVEAFSTGDALSSGMKLLSLFMVAAAAIFVASSDMVNVLPRSMASLGLLLSALSLIAFATGLVPTTPQKGVFFAFSYSGIFSHKNSLGINSALFTISAFHCWSQKKNGADLITIILASICLALSGAATAVVATGFAILCYQIPKISRPLILAACAIGVALPWALTQLNLDDLWELLGRNGSLSGRNIIWQYVTNSVLDAPVIGHGLIDLRNIGGWASVTGKLGAVEIPHSHNTWLETAFISGFVGVALLFVTLFAGPLSRPKYDTPTSKYLLALMAYLSVDAITGIIFTKFILSALLILICATKLRDRDRSSTQSA